MKQLTSAIVLVGLLFVALPLMAAPVETKSKVMTNTSQHVDKVVNINKATIEQLQSLKGIGKKKAQAIINYRQKYGQFKTVQQITEVSGIGDNVIKLNGKNIAL